MMKRTTIFCTLLLFGVLLVNPAFAKADNASNYATTTETFFLFYDGYLQLIPSYRTTSTSGYGLAANKNVCIGYINYSRNGESVIGGRQYTSRASASTSYNTYYVTASCTDTLNPFAAKTQFNWGWEYF